MRLSYVLDTFGGGGKERRCLQIIQGLNRNGVKDVQVIIFEDKIEYKELYDTSAHIVIIDRKKQGLSVLQTVKTLRRQLKEFGPHVVQAWGIMSAGLVLLAKPFLKFKFIVSYVADADVPLGINAVIIKVCNIVCNKVISNSLAGLKAYGSPASKSVIIYNGFNEKRFDNEVDKDRKKEELGITTKYVVAMVASFWRTKDWQCYLDAAKYLICQRQDITFLAVGKGPQWNYYNKQIEDSERGLIKMLGRRDDVDEIYQICDLTVLMSFHREGVSNSILESMAWGVPVLATNSGGTPEIIKNDENGLLLDTNDVELLSKKILNLIDDEIVRNDLGKRASETVCSRFLLNTMTQKYIDMYKSLI